MTAYIVHLTARPAWMAALKSGLYRDESLAKNGFIHFSTETQILRVANLYYRGQHGLVLLVVAPARLTSELRWEPGADLSSELFPHLYGPLNLEAVVRVADFEPGPDGLFNLPAL